MNLKRTFKLTVAVVSTVALTCVALADGTDVLDIPSIPVAPGTDAVYAGVGLVESQPGTIELTVPEDVTIVQVLLYWAGRDVPEEVPRGVTDDVTVNGHSVEGLQIGGPIATGSARYQNYAYRADITALGVVGTGENSISVGDLTFTQSRYGAGVVVITDDGNGSVPVELRDGLDFAYLGTVTEFETVPQTFYLGPSDVPRNMVVRLMVCDVISPRPNALAITAGGTEELLVNPFFSGDGNWWDTLTVPVVVPAGAESLTVKPMSYDDGSGLTPSSLFWINVSASSLEDLELYGCTPGYWKNHLNAWPEGYDPDDLLADLFDLVKYPNLSSLTLNGALAGGGGSGLTGAAKILLRAAVAAVLNEATYGVQFPPYDSVQQLVNTVNDVLLLDDRALLIELGEELDTVNNLGCNEGAGQSGGPATQAPKNTVPQLEDSDDEEESDGPPSGNTPPGLTRVPEASGKQVGPAVPTGRDRQVSPPKKASPKAIQRGRRR